MKSTVHLAMGESLSRCRIASATVFALLLFYPFTFSPLLFPNGVASQATAQFLEDLTVYLAKHNR